jgi:uncharacterized protein YdaU (DUF1376 family)
MAALPYIQLYVADYLADTMHLTTEEHGAYLLLIFNYWQTGKPIPKSRLARIARLSNDRWISVEVSLKEFFNDNGEEWVHDRIDRDLDSVHSSKNQKSAAGKASAEAKRIKKLAEAQRKANARSTNVEVPLQQNSTNRDTDTDTDIKETPPPPAYAHDEFDSRTKFAMHKDWQPDEKSFAAVLFANAMASQTFHEDQFLEFKSFWTASPDEFRTQAKWEHALAQSLKKDLRNAQAAGRTTDGHTRPNQTGAGQRPARERPLSAVERVDRAIEQQRAARDQASDSPENRAAGGLVENDDGDLRPPLDVEFRRVSETGPCMGETPDGPERAPDSEWTGPDEQP